MEDKGNYQEHDGTYDPLVPRSLKGNVSFRLCTGIGESPPVGDRDNDHERSSLDN